MIDVVPDTFDNSMLISFWFLIKSIKDDMLFMCRNDGALSYIGNEFVRAKVMFAAMNMDSIS